MPKFLYKSYEFHEVVLNFKKPSDIFEMLGNFFNFFISLQKLHVVHYKKKKTFFYYSNSFIRKIFESQSYSLINLKLNESWYNPKEKFKSTKNPECKEFWNTPEQRFPNNCRWHFATNEPFIVIRIKPVTKNKMIKTGILIFSS